MQPTIEINNVKFAYGAKTFTFGSAQINPGEIVVLVGPSGSGKSTLMKLLRGELDPVTGSVSILGEPVKTRKNSLVLDESKAGWVPQLDDLQNMMSVEENIGFHILRMEYEERMARIESLKQALHLEGVGGQLARTLSGGQRQRVSIAKAMANRPPVLLMDESLAQLDLRTKTSLLLDLKAMVRTEGVAALLVLHDPADALLIADVLWVVQDGELVQKAPPVEVFNHPISMGVAGLFHYINVLPASVRLSGPWREEGEHQWLYAQELTEIPGGSYIDTIATPQGSFEVWDYQGHKLLKAPK
ncbi:MAG: hypothetical protein RL754_1013 [Bacteroidota bacterium]|jgi:iron(III) transport system ATP-binding protein